MKARYLNPYTDFGFKKLFGEEASKDLLLDFLNNLLSEQYQIAELEFKPTELLPDLATERKAIFDIHCLSTHGDSFIVEMQKAKIKFFKDRSIYYTTFPIRDQAEKGDWDFKLSPIFCIAILDFVFDEERAETARNHISKVQLKDEYCNVFYDKLTYIFIEMPRFNKSENELKTQIDKWLYFLKHLENFNDIPQILNEPVFRKGFDIAEIANFDTKQLGQYEDSLKIYRDLKGVLDTAFEEGETKGKIEGKLEVAKNLKMQGVMPEVIAAATGFSIEEIKTL